MKLIEEFTISKSYKIWTWSCVVALFLFIYWNRIKMLSAGGMLFVYECMAIVFVLRYMRQILYVQTAKMLDKHVEGVAMSLNPFFWSTSKYSFHDVIVLELRPLIILTGLQIIIISISYFIFTSLFVTHVLIGALVLSLGLYNKSLIILYRCFQHPHATYKYASTAFKIQSNHMEREWPTAEKLIETLQKGST